MLDRAPSVVITSKKNELKVYQGNTVYLNDGDNFELRFFNPMNFKVGVEINFNGIKKGDGYLVLNPGQDIILDRFLDEQRKMLFETYIINGNSKEAVEAIAKNGIITFNFYKEHGSYVPEDVNINYAFPPKPFKHTRHVKGMNGNSGTVGNSGTAGTPYFTNSVTTSVNYNSTFTSPGVSFFESDISYSTGSLSRGISTENLDLDEDYCFTSSSIPVIDNLETGRIEMGEISNQQLKTVNAQFSSTPIHTVTYQLLPYSAMNRTIGEIREYCTSCGYRLRKNTWDFCPKCGSKIN
jgi:hypothetical protein